MPQLPYQGPSGIGGGGGGEVTFVSREHSNFAPSDRAPSTLLLDNRGKSISQLPAKRGVPVRTPGGENKPPPPLRTLSTLYEHVLSWDFEAKGDKPPDFPFKLTSIPNLFDKDRAYAATFEPLLILECWEQMQKSRDEMFAEDKVGIKLSAVQMVDNFHDLTLSSAGQDMRLRGFSEHDVLIMTAVDKRGGPSPAKFLCKVNTVSFKGDEAVIQARAYVGKTPSLMPALCINSKWHAIRTYSLTTAVREYSSLCTLPSLALKEDILSPQKVPKPAPKTNEVRTMMDRYGLNEPQAAAISGALARKSGFTLIQGPPGTGKTKTILGLISAFLSERFVIKVPGQAKSPKTNRLLCCAPSNAAIDEIVRRLKFGISDGSGGIFKPSIVRIGSAEAIHSSVRDVTLDALVEKHADKALANNAAAATDGDDKQEAIRERMTVMKDEREKLRALSNEDDIDGTTAADLQSKIAAIGKKLAGLHEQLMKEKATRSTAALAREKQKRMLKRKILMDADVILTTLSGAGSDQLGDIPELSFPTVIIDEAAQSVELSTLVPLRYGAKRCILVGDPQQLPPTVLSQVGQAQRYEQSLFQRIMNVNPDAPYLLSISYRMHPEISSYVSRAFYGGRLQDAPNMLRLTTAPWHSDPLYPPYQLVNAHAGREQTGRGHSYTNPEEARLCVDLVETLCARYPGYQFAGKIGVITFYKKQVRAIKDLLFRRGWSKDVMQNLDINTVDGFQGQEKEIIILSCVRANNTHVGFISDVRRLNVAMSRAKSSLIVLGHVDTLRTHQVWRQLVDDAVDRKLVVRSSDRIFDLRPAGGAGGPLNLLPEASQEEGGPKVCVFLCCVLCYGYVFLAMLTLPSPRVLVISVRTVTDQTASRRQKSSGEIDSI
ncbi:YLR430Wp-like protein [Geranomyces variabilis]|nr:YLR430Wp-like protein [Geranomyces variabilis]